MSFTKVIGALAAISLMAGTLAWGAEAKKAAAPAPSVKAAADEIVVCPVEKTSIKKSAAVDSMVYKGKTYYFCCAGCKPEFVKHPEKYAAPQPKNLLKSPMQK